MTSISSDKPNVKTKNLTSVIFNDVTNDTQICYHLMYPRNFGLIKGPKRMVQKNGGKTVNKKKRRGRPRKEESRRNEQKAPETIVKEVTANEHIIKIPCSRTRSGRVSRPPKHMSKFIDIKDSKLMSTVVTSDIEPVNSVLNSLSSSMEISSIEQPHSEIVPEVRKIRKNVARFTCSVCKKVIIRQIILLYGITYVFIHFQVYLGRKKLLRHYITFPDHKTVENNSSHTQTSNSSNFDINEPYTNGGHSILFDELMKIVGQSLPGDRVPTFLNEVSNFVYKLKTLKSKLLQPPTIHQPIAEYYVDKNVSKIMNLPDGQIQLNEKAFDEHSPPESIDKTFSTFIDERPTSNMSSMSSNLQSLGYNLNLFPPEVQYDHISDNAMEAEIHQNDPIINVMPHDAQMLDMSLDLFSFDNIK